MLGIDPATRAAGPSALATSALRLVGDGASAAVLAERFAAEGAVVEEARAAGILAELAALGLVRVARAAAESRVHVLTSLGRQLVESGAVIAPGVATQLADLEHLRTDLLSTIAHELRTPLTAVRTCVGILRDEAATPTDAERATLLATIERNADRMQQIVGDILQIARFRTGEIVLQLRAFDAVELARGAIASLAPLTAERGQSIVLDAPGGSIRVYGDHRRLDQALVNLVSNAGKYGREGGRIEVTVRSKGGVASWAVRDDGPGIAPEDQPHLFERFFVGPNDRDGVSRGVGLGLPTALAIAQAHGGRIDVDTAPGAGSTFTLVVPLDGPPDID
jgi:two-component system, OmpR family, phosphate regulon sensor histidine kinase PhoR